MKGYCIKLFIKISLLALFFVSLLNAQVTDTIHVEAGWNLLSLPLKVIDGTKSSLFSTAVSNAFIFHKGYVAKDTLANGYGFWLKFDSADTFLITGDTIQRDTISVKAGWNMIGSISMILTGDLIKSEPPYIIHSYGYNDEKFFSYQPGYGYKCTDTIKPGSGYWINVYEDGLIILSSIDKWCPGIPTVEYEGKTYNTVQIGNQCWLKENLDVGTMIQVSDTAKQNGVIEKYCYNDSIENCIIYGGLYQWNEAMQYTTISGARGICPGGWHIPTLAEFETLSNIVGGDGNELKAIGQGDPPDGEGTNTSGFSALLAGARSLNSYFYGLSYYARFLSSAEIDSTYSFGMSLYDYLSTIDLGYATYKDYGFSIRCLRN